MMKTTGNARSDFWKGKFFNAFSVAKWNATIMITLNVAYGLQLLSFAFKN
jgi:hypothetical protein